MMEPTQHKLAMARYLLFMEQPQRALETLKSCTAVELEDDTYWEVKAQALSDLDQHAEAVKAAQIGLGRVPESTKLLYLLATAEGALGNLANAERAILSALELSPEDPLFLCRYALLVAQASQFDKAERLVNYANRIAPEHQMVARTRVLLAYLRGDDRRVQVHSQELLAKTPEDTYGHYVLGHSLVKLGLIGSAAKHFQTAARIDPGDNTVVDIARESKYHTHWLLWPLRPFYRLGPITTWFIAMLITYGLVALGWYTAALIFIFTYLILNIYSLIAPRLIRWWSGWRRI